MANCSSTGTSKSNSNEVRSGRDGSNSANKMSILRKMDVDFPNGQILPTPHLKIFTLSELKSATSEFQREAIIGGVEFGTVFKGWLDEKTLAPAKPGSGMVTAIEKLNPKRERGIREWQSEIHFLGRLSHPNLVKLLGYCLDEKEVLLVYEFMAEGSLEQHLFKKGSQPLSWSTRLKILIGAARGLSFLHTCDKQVIYRDFKASNILLDSNYHAKLSDFGLVKNGPSAVCFHFRDERSICKVQLGTYGYAPPVDEATGDLYVKSDDVYGFGGVLLEMLTGPRALDASRPSGQQNLVDWTRPLLSDRRKLEGIMDKQLEGQYLPEVALKAPAQLSLKCTLNDPRSRPSMQEVVDALEQIEAASPAQVQLSADGLGLFFFFLALVIWLGVSYF